MKWPRRFWAAARAMRGRWPAGFQYSEAFLERAEAQIPRAQLAGEVISFNQHFPRAATVRRAGGRITYYIDATFAALSSGRGLNLKLPSDVVAAARALERENYALADRVVAMAGWTTTSAIQECGVSPQKAYTVLPGANLELPETWRPPDPLPGRMGRERPFVLGFVGKDWRRKGLAVVCDVRDSLAKRGWNAVVRAAGNAPPELRSREGMEFHGSIDKSTHQQGFVKFLASCDVGCLFSDREAFGISTLEFLRTGVPVAGYAIEGPAETLPQDAGFRFRAGTPTDEIAEILAAYLDDETAHASMRDAAARYSPLLTWDRCVGEFERIWAGDCFSPFRVALEAAVT
jgi:glycosyltransferase involved in cell wall biosynthesis